MNLTKIVSQYVAATRGAIVLGAAAAVITSAVVGYTAINATDINPGGAGDESISLAVNTYVADSDVTIDSPEISISTATAAAAGDSAPGVEGDDTFPAVNDAITADNYAYQFVVKESGVATWSASEDFRIRVYAYDSSGPTTTLLATLYAQQAVADGANVEGVTVTVDLGSTTSIYDSFDIIVDRQGQ